MIDDWQHCTALVDGRYSLSGVHSWHLTGRRGEKERRVVCHFCGAEPPRGAKRRELMDAMLAWEQSEADRIKRQRELRKMMQGPA